MKNLMLWMLLLAFALCSLSCGRKEQKYYGRPGPADDIYVMDSQTNKIEGLLILPDKWGGIGLPGRLYERREFSYDGDKRMPLYDFVENLGKLYNFPISWDPEPNPKMRSVPGLTVRGKYNFYNIFRLIVLGADESNYQKPSGEPYDPNVISVGIVKRDGAIIKRVRRATHFKKM
ncbi:hypothetical protein HQ563_16625 [bacterium]|nr:hypothetical protein [bacterium]